MERQILLYEYSPKKIPQIFSQNQLNQIQQAITNKKYWRSTWGSWMKARNELILAMLIHLAARPKEICKIKITDIDWTSLKLKISGENNKTGKDRYLVITEKVEPYLNKYLSFSKLFWKGSEYLFPSNENSFISPERWKHIFREDILKPSGLWLPPEHPETGNKTPPRRSYTLRHTKLSQVLEKTKDIFVVSKIAGHSKIDSSKVYIHTSDSYMDYIREALS